MNKLNLKSTEVLKKKFETELSGYSAEEVDKFLDLILSDYKYYEESIRSQKEAITERLNVINDRDEEIEILKIELKSLKSQLIETAKASDYNLYQEIKKIKKKLNN